MIEERLVEHLNSFQSFSSYSGTLHVRVAVGASRDGTALDAARLALDTGMMVKYEFNDIPYCADPKLLCATVLNSAGPATPSGPRQETLVGVPDGD